MSILNDLSESWPDLVEAAGVTVVIGGESITAVQSADERAAMDAPFDAPSTLLESELVVRADDALGLRRESLLLWNGKKWRVADIRRHEKSPFLLARVVREA